MYRFSPRLFRLVALVIGFSLCGWFGFVAYSEFAWVTRCLFGRGLCVRLFVDGDARVGNKANLRVAIDPRGLQTDAQVQLDLPSGVQLVENNLIWQESLMEGKRSSRTLPFVVKQAGEWEIKVFAISKHYGAFGSDTIYIRSSSATSEVSDRPLPNKWQPSPNSARALPVALADNRFVGSLDFSGQPQLGQKLVVTYSILAQVPLQNVTFNFLFPEAGFETIDVRLPQDARDVNKYRGSFTWVGDLQSAQPTRLTATFKITEIGNDYIVGFVRASSGNLAQAIARLDVNQYSGKLEFVTPTTITPTRP